MRRTLQKSGDGNLRARLAGRPKERGRQRSSCSWSANTVPLNKRWTLWGVLQECPLNATDRIYQFSSRIFVRLPSLPLIFVYCQHPQVLEHWYPWSLMWMGSFDRPWFLISIG